MGCWHSPLEDSILNSQADLSRRFTQIAPPLFKERNILKLVGKHSVEGVQLCQRGNSPFRESSKDIHHYVPFQGAGSLEERFERWSHHTEEFFGNLKKGSDRPLTKVYVTEVFGVFVFMFL